jgi:hypothetical protein
MDLFFSVLLVINLLLALGLALLFARLWQLLRRMQARMQQLAPNLSGDPARGFELIGAARPSLISIEILNPMELAAKQSWVAGTLGSITPALVRRLVYQRATQMVREELKDHGVVAEVRQHHAP